MVFLSTTLSNNRAEWKNKVTELMENIWNGCLRKLEEEQSHVVLSEDIVV